MTANAIARLVALWAPGDRETYEERAAIHEYHGNLPRDQAERLAYEAVLEAINARNTTQREATRC